MNMMKTIRNQKGFSLLELLVAIVLLTIGLLAVASMQATAINANAMANQNTVIASLTQQAYEDIISWAPIDGTPDSRLTADVANVSYNLDPIGAGPDVTIPSVGTFTARYSVTTGVPAAGMAQIVVTVTGAGKTVTLTGYKMIVAL